MAFSVLLRRQVAQCIGWPIFVKEMDVIIHLFRDGLFSGHVQVHEHLGLNPSIDRFHCSVICRRSGT